jgi:D-amino-acid dehydrogenase
MSHVVVIGGGVIGAASAYYLRQSGWDVTVVDKGEFGQGCSHGNCGFVCPSHVLPLAEPGAVWNSFKAIFAKNAPFKIKFRFSPALWSWLFRFARRCNRETMLADAPAIQALLKSSRSLYEELIRTEDFDCEWQTRGLLYVFRTQEALDHYRATDQLLRERFGLQSTYYEGAKLPELEPALLPGLAGAFHYPGDAHLRPDRLLSSWRKVLEAKGVAIRERCEVRGFVRESGKAVAVDTAGGSIAADAFVVALGAWTPFLNQHLGCKVLIQPGKGYSITMPRPARCPAMPLIFHEHRVAVTPWQSGYRLGSTMEFAGYDTSINPARLELLRAGARPYLHEPHCEPVQEEWYGWRPMTYDSKPIIDRSPALSNVIIAAGHNMLGLSMATGTGKLVAQLLTKEPPHIDPAPYSVTRF